MNSNPKIKQDTPKLSKNVHQYVERKKLPVVKNILISTSYKQIKHYELIKLVFFFFFVFFL